MVNTLRGWLREVGKSRERERERELQKAASVYVDLDVVVVDVVGVCCFICLSV